MCKQHCDAPTVHQCCSQIYDGILCRTSSGIDLSYTVLLQNSAITWSTHIIPLTPPYHHHTIPSTPLPHHTTTTTKITNTTITTKPYHHQYHNVPSLLLHATTSYHHNHTTSFHHDHTFTTTKYHRPYWCFLKLLTLHNQILVANWLTIFAVFSHKLVRPSMQFKSTTILIIFIVIKHDFKYWMYHPSLWPSLRRLVIGWRPSKVPRLRPAYWL